MKQFLLVFFILMYTLASISLLTAQESDSTPTEAADQASPSNNEAPSPPAQTEASSEAAANNNNQANENTATNAGSTPAENATPASNEAEATNANSTPATSDTANSGAQTDSEEANEVTSAEAPEAEPVQPADPREAPEAEPVQPADPRETQAENEENADTAGSEADSNTGDASQNPDTTLFGSEDSDFPLRFAVTVHSNYQLGFETLDQSAALNSAFGSDAGLLFGSGFSVGFAVQLFFDIGEAFALGVELGFEGPVSSLVPTNERPASQIRAVSKFIPRVFFHIDFQTFVSLNILAGARVNTITYTPATTGANPTTGTNVQADIEVRVLFELSDSFSLYTGLNYIFPGEVDVETSNPTLNPVDRRFFNLYSNALNPIFGLKVNFN